MNLRFKSSYSFAISSIVFNERAQYPECVHSGDFLSVTHIDSDYVAESCVVAVVFPPSTGFKDEKF